MPNEDQRGGSGNFSNHRDRAAEAGRKGGQSQQPRALAICASKITRTYLELSAAGQQANR
ncbi:MAG: KGG domain-containing protein [Pseudomonadota bacterium]